MLERAALPKEAIGKPIKVRKAVEPLPVDPANKKIRQMP